MTNDKDGRVDHHVPTEDETEITATLEDVAREEQAECRLCGAVVEGESFGEILEKLAEHGEEEHDWGGPNSGWSA